MVAGVVVLFAARADPVLSPDSITYLSAADSLRGLDGFADFTGAPLAHFPPVFPALLAPGGRSLVWASIVGAVGAAVTAGLLFELLSVRVRSSIAFGGALAFALAQSVVRTASTVWSETPYLVGALAMIAVLRHPEPTGRRVAVGGALAGLVFLTRYAGVGVVATGVVMVIVATSGSPGDRWRRCTAFLAGPAVLGACWMARNLIATGTLLGPHFEGGADESIGLLARRHAAALGRLVVDVDAIGWWTLPAGYAALIGLTVAVAVVFARRPLDLIDVGMALFGLTSILVPTVSRLVAATHIEARIDFPLMVPIVYFAALGFEVLLARLRYEQHAKGVSAVVVGIWCAAGIVAAVDAPHRLAGSAGRTQRAPIEQLYASIDRPADTHVLTNSPHRFWWTTGHRPTWFAFTRPQPGNSHFPLSVDETVRRACEADTVLAWFPELRNAGGRSPDELRPDLASVVALAELERASSATLFRLDVRDRASCPG